MTVSYILLGTFLEIMSLLEVTVSLVEDTCTGSSYAKSDYIKVVSDKNVCVRSVCSVKHLRMYSQSFWILKLNLFGTRLETGVEAG